MISSLSSSRGTAWNPFPQVANSQQDSAVPRSLAAHDCCVCVFFNSATHPVLQNPLSNVTSQATPLVALGISEEPKARSTPIRIPRAP